MITKDAINMKKLILSSLGLFFSLSMIAQSANPNNFQKMVDFLPPAPNASAIIKHGDISLNKNTGAPSINIPLFNIKGIKLSAGVSIGYSSTGIKVDEIASRVGMGWALNSGGVVTRTVRGWPDENTTRLVPPFENPGYNCGTYSFLSLVASSSATSGYDAEPDLFNFNMNGNSGTFVLDLEGEAVMIPAEKYKIEKDFSANASWNFRITTTDGIKYYFGGSSATEKTKRNNNCGKTYDQFLANAWYLTKIEHPNGEVINLSYTALTYAYETGVSESIYWAGLNNYCTTTPPSTTCVNWVTTQGVLLSSIYNSNSAVNFTYTTSRQDCGDKLISSVTQVIDGQTTGIFTFAYNEQHSNMTYLNHSYLGHAYTPYLISLTEASPDQVFTKTHLFAYNDPGGRPPRLSYSQDHWGYFNGRINNTFIPKPVDFYLQQRFPTALADREAYPGYAMKGMLTKIVYPTGGFDNIDYEGNDVRENYLSAPQTYHEYNCNVTGITTSTSNHVENSKSMTFSITNSQIVELNINCLTQDPANYDPIHMQSEIIVTGISGNVIPPEAFQSSGGSGSQYVRYLNPSWNLAPGTYTVTYKARGASQTTTIKLKYYRPASVPAKNNFVGGVRVRRVMTGNPAETPVVKRYYYAKLDELDVSSMYHIPTPLYHRDYSATTFVNSSAVLCYYTAMSSGSLTNLFNYGSSQISYAYVVESMGENFEGGAVESKFYSGGDLEADLWWGIKMLGSTLSNWSSPLNGKLHEETVYKKPTSGALFPIKKTQYNYLLEATRGRRILYGYNINQRYINNGATPAPTLPCANNSSQVGDPNDSPLNQYDAMRYHIDSWWCHLQSQTETLYDENGANPITTSSNMYYDNEQHLQLTRTEMQNSKNETIKTTNTYTADYTGGVYDQMKTKYMLTQLITSKSENGTSETSMDKINYGDGGNNNYVPVSVQRSVKGNALETEGTIDQYDANGNILQFTNKAGIVTSIIWGYNYRYPVGHIVGASYANAIAQLTGGSVTALQTMDGSILRTEINRIRTGISSASVTTYTYRTQAGVSSITDPNNKTNTYDYDSFNRLLTIKDQDGNVVKKNEYIYTTPAIGSSPTIFLNAQLTRNYQCQNCVSGYTGTIVSYTVPIGKYFSLVSPQDADAQAEADNYGQEYANITGKCISSVTCSGPAYRVVNCGCELGTKLCDNVTNNQNGTYTVTYRYHWSDNYTGPQITETIACDGVDKKLINCTCETGIKVCDNVQNNGGGSYTVTYHYHWSDNTNSSPITETFTCTGADKKVINCSCETGVKVYTASVYDPKGLLGCTPHYWKCTFHYVWSDASYSQDYIECSLTNCLPN